MFYENDKAISNLSGRISLRTAANAALFELQFKGEERLTEAEAGCGHVEQCPLSEAIEDHARSLKKLLTEGGLRTHR